jgi:hypothetical protein
LAIKKKTRSVKEEPSYKEASSSDESSQNKEKKPKAKREKGRATKEKSKPEAEEGGISKKELMMLLEAGRTEREALTRMVEELQKQSFTPEAKPASRQKKPTTNQGERSTFPPSKGKVKFDELSESSESEHEARTKQTRQKAKTPKKRAGQQVDPNADETAYAIRKPSKGTLANTKRWYVVLRGRKVGIFADQWETRVKKYVEGYPGNFSKAFNTYKEAKAYYRAARDSESSGEDTSSQSSEGTVSYAEPIPVAAPARPHRPKKKSEGRRQGVESGAETTEEEGGESQAESTQESPRERRTETNQRSPSTAAVVDPMYAGVDRSTEADRVYEESMSDETKAYNVLIPPLVGAETGKSMINGTPDVGNLTGKQGTGTSGSTDTMEGAFQEFAATVVEGLRGETHRVEGRVRGDPNFNNPTRNAIARIKNLEDLRKAISKLFETRQMTEAGFKSILQTLLMGHENWDERMFELYWQMGVLPQIFRWSREAYTALLMEAERMCTNGSWTEEAQIFLEHHADKLGTIREIGARTRLQLVWQTYTYLRDTQRNRFTSVVLQEKQHRSVRQRMEDMELRLTEASHTPRGGARNPPNPNDDAHKCSRCRSSTLHPGVGGEFCVFKSFRFRVSKIMARTAEKLILEGKGREEAIAAATEKHKNEN